MNSLYARSITALIGILIVVGVVFLIITRWTTDRYHQEVTQQLNKTIADYIVAEQVLIDENGINKQALKDIAHMVMIINPSIEVYVLDANGQVIGHALPENAVAAGQIIALQPINKFIQQSDRLPIFGQDPRNPGTKKVFSAAPITNEEGAVSGYLYAVLGGEKHVAAVRGPRNSLIFKVSLMSVVALIAFALLSGLFIFYLLTRRLRTLVTSINEFRDNGFSRVIPAAHQKVNGDEIDTLAVTFNRMSQKIVSQMHELRQIDIRRRELMQNVSHDLRTPLASMQGYIDTLQLKFEQLTDQQKHEYLATASRHGRHLSQLVKELFELANLDSGILKIKRESFSMTELVQDVVQKFKLDAARRGVTLQVSHQQQSALVSADIGMLERVLENLIDNALKHTHTNGNVRISIKIQGDKVVTTILDDGAGISSDDLPRIFERSFVSKQGDPNRPHGTGLGLAIVKKILQLHGSDVEVASKLGKGTVFSFQLHQAA